MRPHQARWLSQIFGISEDDFIDLPTKISGTMIARYAVNTECSYCFPHGMETHNATVRKNKKNWKYKRKNQWHT